MKSSAISVVIVLACTLLFASVYEVEAQGSAGALRARLSAHASQVKNFIKPTADKLPLLRKGAVGTLAALIYAGGMLPTAVVAHDAPTHPQPRDNEMVIISQNDDERLLMPVQGWLEQEETLTVKPLIVSPILVRNLAQTLAKFAVKDGGDELVVSRMLRYWDEHLGERGVNLRAVVERLEIAHKEGQLVSRYGTSYEGYPIEILKQRLALLTLPELTASLNAALLEENGRLGLSGLLLMRAYMESGYVMVEIDDSGRVEMIYPRLYNYSSESELLVAKTGESLPHLGTVGHDRALNIAIINDHDGVVSVLLERNNYSRWDGYNYDPYQHLLTAAKLGRIQMVKALLAEVREHRNLALHTAADSGDLAKVVALLAGGANDLNGALMSAVVFSRESDILDSIVALGGTGDFNAGLSKAAITLELEQAKRFIRLGADDFDAALQNMAEYTPMGGRVAELLIARATDLNAALLAMLRSETAYDTGFEGVEELARMLIRAGADDLKGIIDYLHSSKMDYMPDDTKRRLQEGLLLIFAEERS